MAKPVFTLFAFPSVWEPHASCMCHFAGLCQQGPGQTQPLCRARGICVTEVTRPVGGVEARVAATTHGTHVRVCASLRAPLSCPGSCVPRTPRLAHGGCAEDTASERWLAAWSSSQGRLEVTLLCCHAVCETHVIRGGEGHEALLPQTTAERAPRPREPPSRPVKEGSGKALGDGNPQAIFRGHKCRKGTPILGGRLPPMRRRPSGRVSIVPCGGGLTD